MVRITQLPAETTPTSDDLLAMVDNAGAITKKVTIEDLASGFETGSIDGDKLKDNSVTADKIDIASYPKFSVYRGTAHNSSAADDTVIQFDAELFDIGGHVSSNGRFTAPVNGYYHFDAAAGNTTATNTPMRTSLMVNGVLAARGNSGRPAVAPNIYTVSKLLHLNQGDYVEAAYLGGGGSAMYSSETTCYFTGYRVG